MINSLVEIAVPGANEAKVDMRHGTGFTIPAYGGQPTRGAHRT